MLLNVFFVSLFFFPVYFIILLHRVFYTYFIWTRIAKMGSRFVCMLCVALTTFISSFMMHNVIDFRVLDHKHLYNITLDRRRTWCMVYGAVARQCNGNPSYRDINDVCFICFWFSSIWWVGNGRRVQLRTHGLVWLVACVVSFVRSWHTVFILNDVALSSRHAHISSVSVVSTRKKNAECIGDAS